MIVAVGNAASAAKIGPTLESTLTGLPNSSGVDNAQIPEALRGYVQIALDRGLLEAFPAQVRNGQVIPGPRFESNTAITRAVLAAKLALFADAFAAGN